MSDAPTRAESAVADTPMNVVLCWHMHQPEYRDLRTGEFHLPWVYLHAIKDYIDMAAHLEAVPQARAVVNFAPILLEQIEDYIAQISAYLTGGGAIRDPLLAELAEPALPGDEQARLRRVMPPGSKTWLKVTDPPDGVPIRSSDLLLSAGSLQQFEEERDLLRRPASTIGASPRYDWDSMYAWLTVLLFEKGVPDTQTALVAMVQDWFVQNSKSGEVPDESTIRKRLTSLWRKLRGEETV